MVEVVFNAPAFLRRMRGRECTVAFSSLPCLVVAELERPLDHHVDGDSCSGCVAGEELPEARTLSESVGALQSCSVKVPRKTSVDDLRMMTPLSLCSPVVQTRFFAAPNLG